MDSRHTLVGPRLGTICFKQDIDEYTGSLLVDDGFVHVYDDGLPAQVLVSYPACQVMYITWDKY